ncbi:MAG: hypothetical protein LC769_03605 [Chloroflexi bacterium]|nr:hypothetical protein [Chloroflexota bacterium]
MDGATPSLIISRPFVLGEALKATPYQWLDDLRALVRAPIIVCARWPARLFADYRAHGLDAFVEAPFDLDDLLGLTAALCAACPANTGEISDVPFAAARAR